MVRLGSFSSWRLKGHAPRFPTLCTVVPHCVTLISILECSLARYVGDSLGS